MVIEQDVPEVADRQVQLRRWLAGPSRLLDGRRSAPVPFRERAPHRTGGAPRCRSCPGDAVVILRQEQSRLRRESAAAKTRPVLRPGCDRGMAGRAHRWLSVRCRVLTAAVAGRGPWALPG